MRPAGGPPTAGQVGTRGSLTEASAASETSGKIEATAEGEEPRALSPLLELLQRLRIAVHVARARLVVARGDSGAPARLTSVAGLEGLEQLVARRLVNGHVVAHEHPVGPLEVLHIEDLRVDRLRVVDDHHDLGLRIEVGARSVDQLLELIAASVGHARSLTRSTAVKRSAQPPSSRSWRSTSASMSSDSWPRAMRRSLRATTTWRTSSRSASSAGAGRVSAANSASISSGASPRRSRRADFASSI